ncbi:hypothetical protein ILUMI_21628, partial [Ignelater luminosus]
KLAYDLSIADKKKIPKPWENDSFVAENYRSCVPGQSYGFKHFLKVLEKNITIYDIAEILEDCFSLAFTPSSLFSL